MTMLLRRCHRLLAGVVADLRHRLDGFLWARPAAAHATGTGTDLCGVGRSCSPSMPSAAIR